MNYILEIFLILMPWARNPASLDPLPLPVGSLFAGLTYVPLFYFYLSRYANYIRRQPAIFALLFYCIFSYCLGIFNLDGLDRLTLYLRRDEMISYLVIGGKKLLQVSFIVAAYYLIVSLKENDINRFRLAWAIGLVLSLSVHLIVCIIMPAEFLPRAGTFEEGNYAGLYYILSLCVLFSSPVSSLTTKLLIYSACGLGIILSESTIGIVVFILMSGIYIIRKGEPYLKWLSIISLIGALSLALIFNVNKLNEKLFSANTTTENMSKYDRLQSFDAGEKIFMEYPVLGLGLEAYGFLVNDKIEQDDFIFYNYDFRRIPNNVYIEILSQLGLIGCMLFCFIFYKIMKPLYNVSLELFLGVIGILVYWIAFPTFSVAYIWAYLGFCTLITNIQTDRYLTPSVGGLRDHL